MPRPPAGRNYDYPVPYEGRMVRQQLARMVHDAAALHNALRDTDDLPAWVLLKVNTAEDRLHAAADYMRYKVSPGLNAFDAAITPVQYAVPSTEYGTTELTEGQKTFNLFALLALGGAFIAYVEAKDWLASRKKRKA
jgi:hypothetical protein